MHHERLMLAYTLSFAKVMHGRCASLWVSELILRKDVWYMIEFFGTIYISIFVTFFILLVVLWVQIAVLVIRMWLTKASSWHHWHAWAVILRSLSSAYSSLVAPVWFNFEKDPLFCHHLVGSYLLFSLQLIPLSNFGLSCLCNAYWAVLTFLVYWTSL